MTTNQKFKSTSLLSPEENKDILHMLDRKCISLVTTVAQLYYTDPPDHSEWIYKDCGVLCLVRDCKKKKHYFRMYCLVRKSMIWEYEIHKNLEFICPTKFLSSFEGDECIFAFNFACPIEANSFNASVFHRIPDEDITRTIIDEKHIKQRKAKKLSKKDISNPIEPQHNFHVGFKNSEVMKLSPAEIESYFEKKNINKKFLRDKPEIVPSVVASIQVFPKPNNQDQQCITAPKTTKLSHFGTFRYKNIPNSTSAPNSPLLQRSNTKIPKVPPKPTPKPFKMSLLSNNIYQKESSIQRSLPNVSNQFSDNQNESMSIDDSLAILDQVSDLLKNFQDIAPQTSVGSNQTLPAGNFKEMLMQKVQAMRYDSSDASDSDWDS